MTRSIPTAAPQIVELEPRHAAVVRVVGNTAELPSMLRDAFQATARQIGLSGAQTAGPPFARYLAFGETVEADVGFPYTGSLNPSERVHDATLPGGRAVVATHVGPYSTIGGAWEDAQAWMRDETLETTSPPWEVYLTGPSEPGPPVTQIVFPVA